MTEMKIECLHKPWLQHYGKNTNVNIDKIKYKNIAEMVYKSSQKWGNLKAHSLVLPNGACKTLSFKEINTYSDAFAVYLKEVLKINKGDKVALQMPNCLAYSVAVFGVLKAGGVVVNTNPLYTPQEMIHQFSDSHAKILVIIDMFSDKLKEVIPNTKIEKVILVSIAEFFPALKKLLIHTVLKHIKKQIPKCPVYSESFANTLKLGASLQKSRKIDVSCYWNDITLSDVCALQYTGGTTGVSKGAMLSHGNILSNVSQILEMGKEKIIYGNESLITVLPLYHIFAFTLNLVSFFYCGGHNILIPNPRPLSNLRKAFEKFPVTWIAGVNTLFNGLLNESWFADKPPKYLKAAVSGGTALHRAVAERWQKVTKTPAVEGFGLTETSPVVTFNPLNGLVKLETVGIPVPGTDIVMLDDFGLPVPLGEPGEIAVKGPQVMLGYWNRQEETNKVLKDGWLLTGDVGTMDSDGYIKIVDRKKDMIIVSGFNVYPNEVEDCIAKLHGVGEVAVIGVPNDKTGEAVKAYIVRKDPLLTADGVVAHCREYITSYKIPKVIEFREELPKTPIGKILRKNLRTENHKSMST